MPVIEEPILIETAEGRRPMTAGDAPKGDPGPQGPAGDQHVFVQTTEPPQTPGNVWIDPSTDPALMYVWVAA